MKVIINFLNKFIEVLDNPTKILQLAFGYGIMLCILYTTISFLMFIFKILF